jgi:antirestriction protein ArdC
MMGFNSSYWLTFKQAKALGGSVRSGEKGCPVVFWSVLEKKNPKTNEIEKIPFIRHTSVFNIEQCEGIEVPAEPNTQSSNVSPIKECEAIVSSFKASPKIIHKEQQAYYSPSADIVNMPIRESFESAEEYYSTLFHELVHSTAHSSRLNRKATSRLSFFGSEDYSKEELIAEFGSSFLCATAGIDAHTINNSAAYIKNWVSALRNQPKMLVEAASQAQKACDFILGKNLSKNDDSQ